LARKLIVKRPLNRVAKGPHILLNGIGIRTAKGLIFYIMAAANKF
jgi:hypothetical protein